MLQTSSKVCFGKNHLKANGLTMFQDLYGKLASHLEDTSSMIKRSVGCIVRMLLILMCIILLVQIVPDNSNDAGSGILGSIFI